jgi:hypothetical protein
VFVTAKAHIINADSSTSYSAPVTVAFRLPDAPILSDVRVDAGGNLVLVVLRKAFNGTMPAVYQFEIQSAINSAYIRQFPSSSSQADFSADAVTAGALLQLPVKQIDLSGKSTFRFMGVAADGRIDMAAIDFVPTPPSPVIQSATVTRLPTIPYLLKIQWDKSVRMLREAQQGAFSVMVCADQSGATTYYTNNLNYLGYGADSSATISLPTDVGKQDRVYLIAKNQLYVTMNGAVQSTHSSSTVTVPLDIPPPPLMDGVASTRNGTLAVHVISTGLLASITPAGYKWGIFNNTNPRTAIRDFPSGTTNDFPPSAFAVNAFTELPFDIAMLKSHQTFIVAVRAIGSNGKTSDNELMFTPYASVPLAASLEKSGSISYLNVSGEFYNQYPSQPVPVICVQLGTRLDGSDLTDQRITPSGNGPFSARYQLSQNVSEGAQCYLRSYYWRGSDTSVVFRTTLTPSCEPMFITATQISDNTISLPVVKTGFNGANVVAGYQYAIGSDSTKTDIRPLPASAATFDFTAGQVKAGSSVQIPIHSLGMPGLVYVTLKALSTSGASDICRQPCALNPTVPVITVIGARQAPDESNNYLKFSVAQSSVDAKCASLTMRFWYGTASSGPTLISKGGYGYDTWDWSYTQVSGGADQVLECPITKLVMSSWDLYAEIRAQDVSRTKNSGTYKLKFRFDSQLNVINVQVIQTP